MDIPPSDPLHPKEAAEPSRPRWWPAFGRGLAVSLLGGLLWGIFSLPLGIRLEWVPVLSVGFFVGLAVRGGEPRGDWRLGLTGALLALPGCVVADLFSLWGVVVFQTGMLPHIPFHPDALRLIFLDKWGFPDFLAYCCAAFEGYHFAVRRQRVSPSPAPNPGPGIRRGPTLVGSLVLIVAFGLLFLNFHRSRYADLALSPDGHTLAAAHSGYHTSIKNMVVLWDLPGGQRSVIEQGSVGRLAWSRDSRLLAVISNANTNSERDPGQVVVWRIGQAEPLAKLTGHRDFVECLTFSPAGRVLATGSQDGTVKLWNTPTFTERATLAEEVAVSSVAFSADGRLLAVGLRDGTLSLWDVKAASRHDTRKAHRAAISGLLFTGDGKLFSAGSVDGTVKVWEVAPFAERAAFRLPMGWITGLTLSPDGRMLAVAGGSLRRSGEVKLLDSATGEEIRRFEVHANTVCAAVFTRDGKTLIAATAAPISPFRFPRDGEIYRWDVHTGTRLEPLP